MPVTAQECCVLNEGNGAWAFEPLATQLAASLGIEVATEPRRFNYLLQMEQGDLLARAKVFIPLESLRLAADKRLLAAVLMSTLSPFPRPAFVRPLPMCCSLSGRTPIGNGV